jgi:nitrate reductase gamma subunit
MLAIVAGGIAGVMCFAGLVLLLQRRLADARIRVSSKPMDIVVLVLFLIQVSLGLLSINVSWAHLDGIEMLKFMEWAQRIVTFRAGAADLVALASPIFKIHILLGLTIFLIFPFTRLVHIWSGFATLYYVLRPYQVVRQR